MVWSDYFFTVLIFDNYLLSVLLQLDVVRPAVNAIVKVFVEATCFEDGKCSTQLFSNCADIIIKLIPFGTILSVGIKKKRHTSLGLGNMEVVEQKLCCV
jgi:hypothetical protein